MKQKEISYNGQDYIVEIERLQKIINHLRNGDLLHKTFDFGCINSAFDGEDKERHGYLDTINGINYCGTHGCAMGEFPVIFPDYWTFNEDGNLCNKLNELRTHNIILSYLGISEQMFDVLFIPNYSNSFNKYSIEINKVNITSPDEFATKNQVADNIELFIEAVLNN